MSPRVTLQRRECVLRVSSSLFGDLDQPGKILRMRTGGAEPHRRLGVQPCCNCEKLCQLTHFAAHKSTP